jgi:hypothetical protein
LAICAGEVVSCKTHCRVRSVYGYQLITNIQLYLGPDDQIGFGTSGQFRDIMNEIPVRLHAPLKTAGSQPHRGSSKRQVKADHDP